MQSTDTLLGRKGNGLASRNLHLLTVEAGYLISVIVCNNNSQSLGGILG